jgi:hypothetical protein
MIRIAWTGLHWEVRRGGRDFRGPLCGTFRPLMLGRNWTGKWKATGRGGSIVTTSFLKAARSVVRP